MGGQGRRAAHGLDDAGADAGHGTLDPLVTRSRQDEGVAGEDGGEERVALVEDVLYRRELLLEDVVDEPCDVFLLENGSHRLECRKAKRNQVCTGEGVGAELGASYRTFTSRISAATSSFVWGGLVGNTLRDMAAGYRATGWVSPCVG